MEIGTYPNCNDGDKPPNKVALERWEDGYKCGWTMDSGSSIGIGWVRESTGGTVVHPNGTSNVWNM